MSLYISLTDKQIHVFTVFSFLIFIMLGLNVLYPFSGFPLVWKSLEKSLFFDFFWKCLETSGF